MPGLAAVVIGSLAVGIGDNTVVFSWMQSVVLNPVAGVPRAGELHLIEPRTDAGTYPGVSWLEYRDLRERLRTVEPPIAFTMVPLYIGERGRVERGNGLLVSGNYFQALGLTPSTGRFFRPDEASTPGAAPVAVISHDYWQTRFAGAPSAIGAHVRINGADLTIVGVAPRGFKGTIMRLSFDVWLPATLAPVVLNNARALDDRSSRGYTVIARLARGATRGDAQAELDGVMRQLALAYPQSNRNVQAEVLTFWRAPRGPQRFLAASLAVLQGLMLLLLLAVCGNTANLILARASARHREMSVRLALGASRWRVARLMLTESLLLALPGGALGAALAVWGTTILASAPPLRVRGIAVSFDTTVDLTSLAFALSLAAVSGLLFGLAPSIQLARLDAQTTLRTGGGTPPRSRLRAALIAVEVAVAMSLLLAAGLFLRSFMATRTEDTGFRRDGVLLAGFDLSGRNVTESGARAFAATLLDRLQALPSIESASIASSVPLDIHGMPMRFFTLEGRARDDDAPDQALTNTVAPGYFRTMKIPILMGRDFTDLRAAADPAEVIVNEAFVRRYLDGAEPLGRRIEVRGRTCVITAVARNSLYDAFGEPPTPIMYFSFRDRPSLVGDIHVRVRAGAETAAAADIRRIVRDIDPELPIYDVRTLNDHIESNLILRRIPARMFSVLAPLLLLLAAGGIYAVASYAVSLRTADIGVRLALGATTGRLVAQIVGEHLAIVGAGALAGWIAALGFVMDVLDAPIDVPVFAGVPALLLVVAALAAWAPARRAARVDPLIALRAE